MSPGLFKGVERAKLDPERRFNSLAHLIDVAALERAYRRQRADAAVGVDGVTKEAYGRNREANLQDLHAMRTQMDRQFTDLRQDMRELRSTAYRQLWIMVGVVTFAVLAGLIKLVFFP